MGISRFGNFKLDPAMPHTGSGNAVSKEKVRDKKSVRKGDSTKNIIYLFLPLLSVYIIVFESDLKENYKSFRGVYILPLTTPHERLPAMTKGSVCVIRRGLKFCIIDNSSERFSLVTQRAKSRWLKE